MPQPVPDDMLYVNICVYFNGLFYLYQVVYLKKKRGSYRKFYLETNLNKK